MTSGAGATKVSSLVDWSTIVVCVRVTPGIVRSVPTRISSRARVFCARIFRRYESRPATRCASWTSDIDASFLSKLSKYLGWGDADADEGRDVVAEAARVDLRGVAADVAALLELLDALRDRRLGESDPMCDVALGATGVRLEQLDDPGIDAVHVGDVL
jgi:hypothetical protein